MEPKFRYFVNNIKNKIGLKTQLYVQLVGMKFRGISGISCNALKKKFKLCKHNSFIAILYACKFKIFLNSEINMNK